MCYQEKLSPPKKKTSTHRVRLRQIFKPLVRDAKFKHRPVSYHFHCIRDEKDLGCVLELKTHQHNTQTENCSCVGVGGQTFTTRVSCCMWHVSENFRFHLINIIEFDEFSYSVWILLISAKAKLNNEDETEQSCGSLFVKQINQFDVNWHNSSECDTHTQIHTTRDASKSRLIDKNSFQTTASNRGAYRSM